MMFAKQALRAGHAGLLLGVLCTALQLAGCASSLKDAASESSAESAAAASLEESLEGRWGIRVEGLRLSAANSMLDFRYRVLDAKKAAPLLDGKNQPYLLDAAHGATLGVPDTPVLGRIRQTARNNNILTDRTYFIMFGNPGKVLRSGDKVTLLLGQVKIADLSVQ
ncbi:hypothetical protein [Rhodoferax lacus]|nr:hypothetical protein [Rhodoferax lacus]